MGRELAGIAEVVGKIAPAFFGVMFVVVGYFFISLDRQRANSVTKDDTQVGVKLVLFALVLAGLFQAAAGADDVIGYMLGGFKGGTAPLKQALPELIVGGGVVGAIWYAFLPRTNTATQKQPERYFLGAVATIFVTVAIVGLTGTLDGLFTDKSWSEYTSKQLTLTIVFGGLGGAALLRFGAASGWVQAPKPPPPPQYPPQGGGYPPPQYPQGGGYPPPAGGGYPQGGGGYPPQGGGGYPPPGSGGYPPQQ